MATRKTTKKEEVKQDNIEEFIKLAKELKEIVFNLNKRMDEVESVHNRIKQRLGL